MSNTATHKKVDSNPVIVPYLHRGGADVPVELLHYIIKLFADTDSVDSELKLKDGMNHISLVSKRFRAVALPYLFTSVSFHDLTSERSSVLAQLIIDHPRVSRFVRNIQYTVRDEDGDEKLQSNLETTMATFKILPLVDSITINDKRNKETNCSDDIPLINCLPRDDGLVMFPTVKSFSLAFERPPATTLHRFISHMPSLEKVHLSYPNHAFRFPLVDYINQTTTPNLKNLILEWYMPARRNWGHYYIEVADMDENNAYVDIGEEDEDWESAVVDPQPMINYAMMNLLPLKLAALETLTLVLHFEIMKAKCIEAGKAAQAVDDETLFAYEDITSKVDEFTTLMEETFKFVLPALSTVHLDIRMKIPIHAKDEQHTFQDNIKSELEYQHVPRWFTLDVTAKVFWDEE